MPRVESKECIMAQSFWFKEMLYCGDNKLSDWLLILLINQKATKQHRESYSYIA